MTMEDAAAKQDASPRKPPGNDSELTIPPEVLEVLAEKWEKWKNGNKGERKRCWKALVLTLRKMEINQMLAKPAWILR